MYQFVCLTIRYIIFFVFCASCEDKVWHTTKYKEVKTHQFGRSVAGDGILWSSKKTLVFSGVIAREDGVHRYGIYELDLESRKTSRVVADDAGLVFGYCLSNSTLYAFSRGGKPILEQASVNFDTVLIDKNEFPENPKKFSRPLCRFVSSPLPQKRGNFWGLFDNLYLYTRPKLIETDLVYPVQLLNQKLDIVQTLEEKNGNLGVPKYSEFNDAYYGYSSIEASGLGDGRCYLLWALKRNLEVFKSKKQCFDSRLKGGSLVILPTKAGLFIEHHSSKKAAGYLKLSDKLLKITSSPIRGTTVSPDGCRIAYASGRMVGSRNKIEKYSQIVKVTNLCEIATEKEK